uniref:Uncharacterized protein n=1 Tax=Zea mays TaxID=4577 RepID=B6TJK0_MAIZE|nr:hypothetical protein [Zea mays]
MPGSATVAVQPRPPSVTAPWWRKRWRHPQGATDGWDVHRGTFPAWMVSSQGNDSSLVLLDTRPGPAVDGAGMAEHLQLHLGQVSLRSWSSSAGCWVARWTFPSDCRSNAFFCVRFGVCTSAGTCACVDEFEPSKPCEWHCGYFVDGCTTRSHPLSCTADDSGRHPTTEQDDSFLLLDNLRGLPYSSIPQQRATAGRASSRRPRRGEASAGSGGG